MVEVSEFVKKKLDHLKRKEQHKSYDSVIRSVLEENLRLTYLQKVTKKQIESFVKA